MIGNLATLPLPDRRAGQPEIQGLLFSQHRIELPTSPWPRAPQRNLRVSAQLYNTIEQYDAGQHTPGVAQQGGSRSGSGTGWSLRPTRFPSGSRTYNVKALSRTTGNPAAINRPRHRARSLDRDPERDAVPSRRLVAPAWDRGRGPLTARKAPPPRPSHTERAPALGIDHHWSTGSPRIPE